MRLTEALGLLFFCGRGVLVCCCRRRLLLLLLLLGQWLRPLPGRRGSWLGSRLQRRYLCCRSGHKSTRSGLLLGRGMAWEDLS